MTRRERLEQFIADWLTPGCDFWQRKFEPRLGSPGFGRKLKLSELTDDCLEDIAADIVREFWRMRKSNRESRAAYAARAAREAAQ